MTDLNWTIYHNPQCSKSREALRLLLEIGIAPKVVKYLKTTPTLEELLNMFEYSGIPATNFLRKNEQEFAAYKDLDVEHPEVVAKIIHECPKLLERPVVIKGTQAIIARPPEKVLEL